MIQFRVVCVVRCLPVARASCFACAPENRLRWQVRICVTLWVLRRVPRMGGRVRAPGHFRRAAVRMWCQEGRASVCCGRYRGYRYRVTASGLDHCRRCRTYTLRMRQLRFLPTRRAMRRRQLPAPTRTPAPTTSRAPFLGPRSRSAECMLPTPCLHISGL